MSEGSFALAREIQLDTHRCYFCGRWWAVERGHDGQCPRCAHRRINDATTAQAKAERAAAALRGALKRAKSQRDRRAKR